MSGLQLKGSESPKVKTVNSNMNLQKLVNRAIHQYLNDEDAKELIETYDKLHLSGSQF